MEQELADRSYGANQPMGGFISLDWFILFDTNLEGK
jgi:hypothetical protein